MPSFARDLRHGARSLRKSPALVAVAVLALTIGIGLTTMMFSIVYGAMMRGLPFEGGDKIIVLNRERPSRGDRGTGVPIQDFADLRAQQRTLEGLAAHTDGTINVSGSEKAERFLGSWVTANTFRLLRVSPVLGRDFADGEDQPGGPKVAIIGYAMWKNRFGGRRDVLGEPLRANGQTFTVIGVMPDGFLYPQNSEIWLPLQENPLATKRGEGRWVTAMGRLKDGVSMDAAGADFAGIAKRLATTYKQTNEGVTYTPISFTEGFIGPDPRRLLMTMLGAVCCVLLIACANVANLLLDRAAHRTKEVGIRTALGASRFRVVRQFLAESLLLSAAGAVLGVGVAYLGIAQFNAAIVDSEPPFWLEIALHPPVLFFTAAVALVASLAAGIFPAWQSSRTDINEILKDESRGASSLRIGKLSKGLVVFEIVLSCVLLVAAGLMIKSVAKLRDADYGFDATHVFTARVGFPEGQADTTHQRQFFERLPVALAALPGVQAVALSSTVPGTGMGGNTFAVEGASYAKDEDYPNASTMQVSAGFLDTYRLPLRQGRGFAEQDRTGSLPVALVNDAFAKKFFKGESPVGRRIRFGASKSTAQWMTIVGVTGNLFEGDAQDHYPPTILTPLAQGRSNFLSMAARTAGPPMAITSAVRDAVLALDPDVPIYRISSLEEAVAKPTWFIRVFGTLFMLFGFVALFLGAVGLYAVMAFSVSRRTREVGIRMALGAQSRDVVGMIFRQGLWQIGVGLAVGLAIAAGVAPVVSMLLFDVQPHDPAIFALVVSVLSLAGMIACLVPARRATRIDPMTALRSE